jgi:hypothetical protein
MWATAFLAAFASAAGGPSDAEEIVSAAREAVDARGPAAPFFAEYEVDIPAQRPYPRILRKYRISAEKSGAFYYEETSELHTSRFLVQEPRFYWEYKDADPLEDAVRFTGSVKLGQQSAEAWLQERDWMAESHREMREGLPRFVARIIAGAKISRRSKSGGGQSLTVATEDFGDVVVSLGPNALQITSSESAAGGRKATYLRYSCREGEPTWKPDPRAALVERIAGTPRDKLHPLRGEYNMATAIEQGLKGIPQSRPLKPAELKLFAAHYGLLLPSGEEFKLLKATKHSHQQLDLDINADGKVCKIIQYLQRPRLRDDETLRLLVKNRRKFKEYTVLDAHHPTAQARWVYYLKEDVCHLVVPPEFNNPVIDKVIASFVPAEKVDKIKLEPR